MLNVKLMLGLKVKFNIYFVLMNLIFFLLHTFNNTVVSDFTFGFYNNTCNKQKL